MLSSNAFHQSLTTGESRDSCLFTCSLGTSVVNRVFCLSFHSNMSQEFTEAADKVKNLKTKPNDTEMLELYGLFKQVTVGDVNTDRPGMFDMKGKAKWDSWSGRKGLSKEDAQQQYIELVNKLIEAYGL